MLERVNNHLSYSLTHVCVRWIFFIYLLLPFLNSLLQDKDVDMCAVNLKVDQLEAELQDLNSQESKDEASLAKVFLFVSVWQKSCCTSSQLHK